MKCGTVYVCSKLLCEFSFGSSVRPYPGSRQYESLRHRHVKLVWCFHACLRSQGPEKFSAMALDGKKMLYLRSTDNIRQVLEVTYFKVDIFRCWKGWWRNTEGRKTLSYERDMGWIRIERNNFCLILTDVINTTHCLLSFISINRIPNIYVQVYNCCFTKYKWGTS